MRRRIAVAMIIAVVLFAVHSTVWGGLLAYEGFDYPAGSNLVWASGGDGFVGRWHPAGYNASNYNNYAMQNGSLEDGDLVAGGNRMYSGWLSSIGGIGRNLAQPVQGHENTTRYLSFLARPEGFLGMGQWSGFFGIYLDGSQGDMYVGKPGGGIRNEWVLERRGGGFQQRSFEPVEIGTTSLLVVRCDFTGGNDIFTLYVDPVAGEPEPLSGTVLNNLNVGMVNQLVVYSTGEFSLDEIRFGETFADVTPVPEVGTLVLLGLGGMIVRRFR